MVRLTTKVKLVLMVVVLAVKGYEQRLYVTTTKAIFRGVLTIPLGGTPLLISAHSYNIPPKDYFKGKSANY